MTAVAVSFPPRLWAPGSGTNFSEVLPKYLMARPALDPKSAAQLQTVCNLAQTWATQKSGETDCSVDEIFSLDNFEAWVKWLFDTPIQRGASPGQRRSPRTVRGKRDSLWTLWRFAHKKGLCDSSPPDRDELAPINWAKEDPTAWSPEQFAAVIDFSRRAPDVLWWRSAHWVSLLWTGWYSAERIGGLLSCRLDDLQGDVLYVRARRTKDKKAGAHRLKPELCDLIRSLKTLAGPDVDPEFADRIWPWPHSINTLRARYRRDILRPAGLPEDCLHLFHCNRRSSLTELVNAAGIAAAQELARHSSPALTLDRYISKRLSRGKAASDVLPDPTTLRPKKNAASVKQLALFE